MSILSAPKFSPAGGEMQPSGAGRGLKFVCFCANFNCLTAAFPRQRTEVNPMRKVVWISLASFALGILLAGYVFVYLPDKKAEARSFLDPPTANSGLFAGEAPQARADLDFVKVSDKVGPAVVKVECEKVERQSMMGMPDNMPGDDFW